MKTFPRQKNELSIVAKKFKQYIARVLQKPEHCCYGISTYTDKRSFGRRLCLKTYQELTPQQIYDFIKELEFEGWLPWSGDGPYCGKMVGVKKYVAV